MSTERPQSTEPTVQDRIETAAATVGSVWPLHSFVTANPLSGFEDQPFGEAVQQAETLFGGDGYPSAAVFRAAWEDGRIDTEHLSNELAAHGYDAAPETLLERMDASTATESTTETATDRVDQHLSKWLAVFLDEGRAEWPMPNREQGFYMAVRSVARYDAEIPDSGSLAELPDDPSAAIRELLADYSPEQWESIFEHHLTALPGWTGFIKQRAADETDWQSAYPISLAGYLAIRLQLSVLCEAPIAPPTDTETVADDTEESVPLAECWLNAWESTYREAVVEAVSAASESLAESTTERRPDAQLVFCIDTRSEIIRRHIEATGHYETHGYAGFFGVPMRYTGYDSDVTVDACPPIVDAQHRIRDRPAAGKDTTQETYDSWQQVLGTGQKVLKSVKSNAATAFGFVESTGVGYGAALAARTLLPAGVKSALAATEQPHTHEFCEPTVDYNPDAVSELREGLLLDEKVEYAASAFELMGIEEFGRLVAFVGHASETTNNPFDSSLDCGACAGNPGGPSARVLAAICNEPAVKSALGDRGIDVPADTVFVAGEHNTTTDEVTLYDDTVPESHHEDIEALRADLETARVGAATERTESMDAEAVGVDETDRRAADWAEPRPEMGLAGNAGFVIGPQELTADIDFDGRSFLHSYDWSTDPEGQALEAIMAGPMVVTQWINTQYYFATVDTAVYGSGSKVTHNPVGNIGVYQGNGGDLMTGLPLQSVMAADDEPYHQPLRLSAVIHAPVDQVTEILQRHDELTTLLDNGWLSLTVVDPTQDHTAFEYAGDLEWASDSEVAPTVDSEPPAAQPVADD